MKSITEFANVSLRQGLKAKEGLAAEGKSPEEIQQSLGETYKYEGDKLKHFMNALEIASQNPENLKRVVVMSFSEGENVPSKATKIEEHHYLPEFHFDPKQAAAKQASDRGGKGGKGRGGGRGGRGNERGGGPKESPWGLSPEQKAAKQGKGPAAKTDAKPT